MGKRNSSVRMKQAVKLLTTSALALAAALVVTGVLIAVCGFNPFEIYHKVFIVTLSQKNTLISCLSQATPLIFAGLAFTIGFRVGIINTGVEGQLIIGGFVAACVGAYLPIAGRIHVVVAILAGALAGGLVAFLTILIKLKTGAPEVVTCIMLNRIIDLVTQYLCNGPLKPQDASSGQTKAILETAYMTRLPKTQLTTAFIVALVLTGVLYVVLNKTKYGYKIRVTGSNMRAGVVAGINTPRIFLSAAFISGAIAGIGGAGIALGTYRRFIDGFSGGLGFSGISVAALAAYSPLAVSISGILFGILKAGTLTLSRSTNNPQEIGSIIQALVVVFISAPQIVTSIKNWRIFGIFKRGKRIKSNPTSKAEGGIT